MLQSLRNRKGFTLVELMIVVAIIGILAAIAIPNFLQFRLKAKTSEAKSNLGAIRSTEVAYFAEWNYYVGNQTSAVPDSSRANNGAKETWTTNNKFSILGFAPEGKVFYSYALAGVTFPVGSEGFTTTAEADLDDDGSVAVFTVTDKANEPARSGGEF